MEEEIDDYKRIYTGATVIVKMLQGRLEEADIFPVVKDDLSSGTWSAFGSMPGMIQLFVHNDEYEKAKSIVDSALEEFEED
jgi:hypothetical protein